jgi:hypothetical protein
VSPPLPKFPTSSDTAKGLAQFHADISMAWAMVNTKHHELIIFTLMVNVNDQYAQKYVNDQQC